MDFWYKIFILVLVLVLFVYLTGMIQKKEGFIVEVDASKCNASYIPKRNVDINTLKSTPAQMRAACTTFDGNFSRVNNVYQCHQLKQYVKNSSGKCVSSDDFEQIHKLN